MQYIALGDRETPEGDMMGLLRHLFNESPRDGILPSEDKNLRNFEIKLFSMKAGPGSVPPNSTVTVTNGTTAETEDVTADQYGQFFSTVGCSSGETLTAVSSVGGVTLTGTCS